MKISEILDIADKYHIFRALKNLKHTTETDFILGQYVMTHREMEDKLRAIIALMPEIILALNAGELTRPVLTRRIVDKIEKWIKE